jgi:hypothetical protein
MEKTNHLVSRLNISELSIVEMSKTDIIEYHFALRNIMFQELPGLQHCDMRADVVFGNFHSISSNQFRIGRARCISFIGGISILANPPYNICQRLISILGENLHSVRFKVPQLGHHTSCPSSNKAARIISASPEKRNLREIALRLGTFYTFTNLLGAMGTLLVGTRLKNILEVVYSEQKN